MRTSPWRRRTHGGYLLLEVLFAIAILAIGLFVLVGGLGRCLAAASSVQNYSVASQLLANKSFTFRTERAHDYFDQEGVFSDAPRFSWSRRFEPTDHPAMWRQVITVYWYEKGKVVSDSVEEYRYLPDRI